MNRISQQLTGFVLLAGIVFGLFIIVIAPIEMYKKAEAENWPSRRAVITSSDARYHRGSSGRMASGSYWKAEICGRYIDNDEKFCVARIRYGGFRLGADKDGATETAARYPVGREVDIYYSPENPGQTVLEAHTSWKEMLVLLATGIILLLLPAILWLLREKIEPDRYGRRS